MACPFSDSRRLFVDLASSRDSEGFQFSEKLGGYVVSRYDDIVSVLDRPELFSSRPTVPEFPPMVRDLFANKVPDKGTLLAHDNPDHDRLRKSVASFFVPRRLERFEPMLRAAAHDQIDKFVDSGSVEIKSQFALPVPLRCIVVVAVLDPARWEWIGRCLALFGGITKSEEELSIQQRVQDVLDLHTYIAGVIEDRRNDRKDDLISHIWNERDAGVVELTDFEHLSMIPGLLLAGHETTTNVLSMGMAHLLHHGLWERVSESDATRSAAIEELLRYESAITGMPRLVTTETKFGAMTLQPGDKLFVAYNSGSRDSTKFENPDEIDIDRHSKTQHLGFGRGVHACLGAPFARLLLRTELKVLRERLPQLELETPYEEIKYSEVHEGRGPEAVRISWDPPTHHDIGSRVQSNSATKMAARPHDQKMTVSEICQVATDVMQITLRLIVGSGTPRWAPGAHIDVKAGPFGFRQYSICSSPDDRDSLAFAVLKTNDTGASHFIHNSVKQNLELTVRGPRNNFSFESGSRRTVFVAGGIGITPIKPMAAEAKARGEDYTIIYLGRKRDSMAFVEAMTGKHANRCITWVTEEHCGQRFDVSKYIRSLDTEGLRVYCCGPEALLRDIENSLNNAPPDVLRLERFAMPSDSGTENTAFDVVLSRSGKVLRVPEDKSILDVINDAGAGVMSTCNKGLCGTCEVRVLDGLPEHRDAVLTPAERAEGTTIMTCVSRCRGSKLVLDLW
ncbi:Carnitine monooxygenase reductase subunit [Colletotrichum siamense]|uniref:Carnitine monooxygenase reductase subunit n=1 Tax=Colletotrichum siamense TaxID=690259 RepID=UPI0018731091|nr:Carnitine monooxygenase reductase subunit [Colletotrichum siamense]KAF5505432.1 Carnitine monooxygenase reductase subunit [Colletotrichum siamense]